jgi:anti-sigma B factor antagonist
LYRYYYRFPGFKPLRLAENPLHSPQISGKTLGRQTATHGQNMNISARQIENATVVDVIGDITLYNSPEVRKTLLNLLREKQVKRVIVNLEKVKYIDSAGVASLVEGLKVSREMKSGFALYGLSTTTREVLELTRLIKVFEVYNTEAEALAGAASAGGAK